MRTLRADHATVLYRQKYALTSPIIGGCLVGIVRLWANCHCMCLFYGGEISKIFLFVKIQCILSKRQKCEQFHAEISCALFTSYSVVGKVEYRRHRWAGSQSFGWRWHIQCIFGMHRVRYCGVGPTVWHRSFVDFFSTFRKSLVEYRNNTQIASVQFHLEPLYVPHPLRHTAQSQVGELQGVTNSTQTEDWWGYMRESVNEGCGYGIFLHNNVTKLQIFVYRLTN
jgi:hypothetical protein